MWKNEYKKIRNENKYINESKDKEKLIENINMVTNNEFIDMKIEGKNSNKNDKIKIEDNKEFSHESKDNYNDLSENQNEKEQNKNDKKVENVAKNKIDSQEQIENDKKVKNENNRKEQNKFIKTENNINNWK